MTVGLAKQIEDMKALFVYAPDTRIKQHPIRFGSGKVTAVTGVFEGTFTKPMPIGGGKFIQHRKKVQYPNGTRYLTAQRSFLIVILTVMS